MPLRRWMEEHGHPGWYSWVVVVGTSIVSTGLALLLAFQLVNAERMRRESDRAALCEVIVIQDEAMKSPNRPITPAGKSLSRALSDLRTKYNCDGR